MKITIEEMDTKVRECLERVGFVFKTAITIKEFIELDNSVQMRKHDGYYELIHNDIILFRFKPLNPDMSKQFELESMVEYFEYI